MKRIKVTDWRGMVAPITVSRAATALHTSQGNIWTLIRQKAVRWGVVDQDVVIDAAELKAWTLAYPKYARSLSEPVANRERNCLTEWIREYGK